MQLSLRIPHVPCVIYFDLIGNTMELKSNK